MGFTTPRLTIRENRRVVTPQNLMYAIPHMTVYLLLLRLGSKNVIVLALNLAAATTITDTTAAVDVDGFVIVGYLHCGVSRLDGSHSDEDLDGFFDWFWLLTGMVHL